MFRTILVPHQKQRFEAVYGNWYQLIPAYTSCDIQFQNVAPDDGLKSPKHVEHLMINKDTL